MDYRAGQSRAFACLDTSDTLSCIHRLEEVPLEVLRQRESKWLDMLNNWDKWMAKKHKKVRGLALCSLGGGIRGMNFIFIAKWGFSNCQTALGVLYWSGGE